MHRLPLPDGAWVDLREANELTVKGKRGITVLAATLATVLPKLEAAKKEREAVGETLTDADILDLGLTEDEMDRMMRMSEAATVAFLAGWSRPEPLPTLASVGGMPAEFYEAIEQATARDAAAVAAETLAASNGDGGVPDPKASSGGSKNSASPSKGSTPRTRTRKSVKRGTPTPTGN
jgi:hypothetical protein